MKKIIKDLAYWKRRAIQLNMAREHERELKQLERVLLRSATKEDKNIIRRIISDIRAVEKKELKCLNSRYKNKKNRYKVLI